MRKRCMVCQKIDRGSVFENKSSISRHMNDEFYREELCSCRKFHGVYYTSTLLLRAIQTIFLVVIFIITTTTLFMVRNMPSLNAGVSSVISGYSESKKDLNDLKSGEPRKQIARQFN